MELVTWLDCDQANYALLFYFIVTSGGEKQFNLKKMFKSRFLFVIMIV